MITDVGLIGWPDWSTGEWIHWCEAQPSGCIERRRQISGPAHLDGLPQAYWPLDVQELRPRGAERPGNDLAVLEHEALLASAWRSRRSRCHVEYRGTPIGRNRNR